MESSEKIKNLLKSDNGIKEKIIIIAIICLVGTASFGLGRLSALEEKKEPVSIELQRFSSAEAIQPTETMDIATKNPLESSEKVGDNNALVSGGFVVASKNGTKYHFPWCSGAKRILEVNKIYFESIDVAKAAGFTPAGNCKGLE